MERGLPRYRISSTTGRFSGTRPALLSFLHSAWTATTLIKHFTSVEFCSNFGSHKLSNTGCRLTHSQPTEQSQAFRPSISWVLAQPFTHMLWFLRFTLLAD